MKLYLSSEHIARPFSFNLSLYLQKKIQYDAYNI